MTGNLLFCVSFSGDDSCSMTQITAEKITEIECSGIGSCRDTAAPWTIDCDPDLNDDDNIKCKMLCTGFSSCYTGYGQSQYVVKQIEELKCADTNACLGSKFTLTGAVCDDDSLNCECGVKLECDGLDVCQDTEMDVNYPEYLQCLGYQACERGIFNFIAPVDEFYIECEGTHWKCCIFVHQNMTGNVLFFVCERFTVSMKYKCIMNDTHHLSLSVKHVFYSLSLSLFVL